jgi:hypothetical protein
VHDEDIGAIVISMAIGFAVGSLLRGGDGERFERQLQCKNIADDYVKRNSDEVKQASLSRVEFSKAQNSCIASFITSREFDGENTFSVENLSNGETLYYGYCFMNSPSGTTDSCMDRAIQLRERRDALFDRVLAGESRKNSSPLE